jgi:hypothetical protein
VPELRLEGHQFAGQATDVLQVRQQDVLDLVVRAFA